MRVSSRCPPLTSPISDAKVLTGRQKPMTGIAMLFAESLTLSERARAWTREQAECGRRP